MRPVCANCSVEMRCERNQHLVVARQFDEAPYQAVAGDRYRCPECAAKVVIDFGAPLWDAARHATSDLRAMCDRKPHEDVTYLIERN